MGTIDKPERAIADHGEILQRFVALNEARLQRTREALRSRQRDFLDLIPFIFHINHPALPGPRAADVPAGITSYNPDKSVIDPLLQRLGRPLQWTREAKSPLPILALYLMGSPGSVAYAEDSDFDIWLCHDPELSVAQLTLLQEKATLVEAWAAELELEVHFFLVNPNQFRTGEALALSSESSGSAQFRLLLEEFYRTGLRLAGCYPVWWLVHPDLETDYESVVGELHQRRYPGLAEFIDFGALAHIPAEEFLGAAIWQLYKGIDSPYKSILKLLLVESYAREYPYLELLSLRFKRCIYAGEVDPDQLDPYLMMLDKVEEYLRARGDDERLTVARRCFYFKVDEHLSNERDAALAGWRRQVLSNRINTWRWGRAELLVLDHREQWKVQRVAEERRILFHAFSESYRFLSSFARRYAGSALISQRDMTILGRKLYAAFERKAGKVELLGRGITENLAEPRLSLHEVLDNQNRASWVLYNGIVKPNESAQAVAVKRTRTVIELLAWCFFNQILEPQSAIAVHARRSHINLPELRALIDRLHAVFSEGAREGGSTEDYGRPARILRGAAFINVGTDAISRASPGKGRVSGSVDALCYGPSGENLAHTIDLVLLTSWQEVLTFQYNGGIGVLEWLRALLKWTPPEAASPISAIQLTCYTVNGHAIVRRVEQLLKDIAECQSSGLRPRYILRIQQDYFLLRLEGENPEYKRLGSYNELLRLLSAPQREFRPVVFDRYATPDKLLPLIYGHARPGHVQLFYHEAGDALTIHVIDERGSLFHRQLPRQSPDTLLSHFGRFFESVTNRVNFLLQEGHAQQGIEGVEFYAIERQGNDYRLKRQVWDLAPPMLPYASLQVILEVGDEGKTIVNLYYGKREFSSLELGNRVFEVAVEHVLGQRQEEATYPIYITDISMSAATLGMEAAGHIQTLHFLTYKQRIEEKLNQAMNRREKRATPDRPRAKAQVIDQ